MQPDKLEQLKTQYLEAVIQEWENLTVGDDESIPLTEVYVMLQAVENRPPRSQESRPTPETGTTDRSGGTDSIDSKREQPPLPLANILAENKHLVLLGEPGAGKSTSLRFIGLCFAHGGWAKEKLEIDELRVPVLLVLKDLKEEFATCPRLENILAKVVRKFLHLTEVEAEELIEEWQESNHLLVLLDGLDEVSDEDSFRTNVDNVIKRYARSDKEKKCRIVISSRVAGYQSRYFAQDKDLRTFTLKPFQHPEDALPFLRKWLKAQPNWDKDRVESESDKLLAEITGRPALRRYIDNPLLLRLAVETYAQNGALASNRGKMYEDYISITIWKDIGVSSLTLAQKSIALDAMEDLAWQLQSMKAIDALKKLQQGTENVTNDPPNLSLLLEKLRVVEVEAGTLSFSHETFQEYFVARRLKKAWQEKESRKRAWIILRPRLHDPNWREPLLLLAGMLDKDNAIELVDKVLNAHSRNERVVFRDLRLAAELLGERSDVDGKLKPVRDVNRRLKKRLVKINFPYLRHYYTYWWTKNQAARSLGAVGMPAVPILMQLLQKRYLGDNIYDLIEWISKHYPNVYTYLSDINNNNSRFGDLPPAPDELSNERKLRFGQVVVRKIWMIGERLLTRLTKYDGLFAGFIRHEDDTLPKIRDAITEIGLPVVPDLEAGLNSPSKFVRLRVINTMGQIKERRVARALVPLLKEPDSKVRYAAVFALHSSGNAAFVVNHLLPLLEDQDADVRRETVLALGDEGEERAIPGLIQLIENSEHQSQYIECLGKIGTPAIPYLTEMVAHGKNTETYVEVLSQLEDVSIIPSLLLAYSFHTDYWDGDTRKVIRKTIGEAIARLGAPAIPVLIHYLQNQNEIMMRMEETLRKMADHSDASYQFLSERSFWTMRSLIIKLLVASGDQTVLPFLHQETDIQSMSWAIRGFIAENDPRFICLIPNLLHILEETPYYSSSAHSLGISESSIYASHEQIRRISDLFIEIGAQAGPYLLKEMDIIRKKVVDIFEQSDTCNDQNTEFALVSRLINARKIIIELLGKIGAIEAVPDLLWLFGKLNWDIAYLAPDFDDVSSEYFQRTLEQAEKLQQAITNTLSEPLIDHPVTPFPLDDREKSILFTQYNDTYEAIVQTLGTLADQRATPALCVELLGTNLNEYYQSVIAEALGKIGDRRAVSALQRALRINNLLTEDGSYDYGLGKQLIWALGEIGDPESIPDLLLISQDSKIQEHRAAAVEALRKIGGSAIDDVSVLREALLQSTGKSDESNTDIIQKLGAKGGSDAEVALREIMLTSQNLSDRREATYLLVKMGDLQAVEMLSEEIKGWNMEAVAFAKKEKRIDALLLTVGTDSFSVASEAIKDMGKDTVSGLIYALHQSANPKIREAAAKLLSEIGIQSSAPAINIALREQLNDAASRVRLVSALALGRLGDLDDRRTAAKTLLRDWKTWEFPYFQEHDEVAGLIGEFGENEAAIRLLLRLGGRGTVMEALLKVISRIKDPELLRWVARKKNLFYQENDFIETVVNRLDMLETPELQNPLKPLPPSSWQKRFEVASIIICIMLLTGLGGALASNEFQNEVAKLLPVSWQVWAIAHPTSMTFIRAFTFAAIGGLITFSVAALLDRIKKTKTTDHDASAGNT